MVDHVKAAHVLEAAAVLVGDAKAHLAEDELHGTG